MPPVLSLAVPELASALRPAIMRLARRMRSEREDADLTLTQLSALGTLRRHGSMSPGELAAHEKVKAPSMTRVLAALEDRGLVERAPHPTDGRQVVMSLSVQGEAMLAEDRRRRDVWLARRLEELTAQEREVLAAATVLLDRLATT
jgi:DNA-binding MarR family transcriptional regulator